MYLQVVQTWKKIYILWRVPIYCKVTTSIYLLVLCVVCLHEHTIWNVCFSIQRPFFLKKKNLKMNIVMLLLFGIWVGLIIFRSVRELFKLDVTDYRMSIYGDDSLRELFPPMKSRSLLYISQYLSQDDIFVIKILKKIELKVWWMEA